MESSTETLTSFDFGDKFKFGAFTISPQRILSAFKTIEGFLANSDYCYERSMSNRHFK